MTDYKAIFGAIEQSILTHLGGNLDFYERHLGWAKHLCPPFSDTYYYRTLIITIFAAGFSINVLDKKRQAILNTFPDAITVSKYDAEKIAHIKHDGSIIRNRRKIDACIRNTHQFLKVVEKFGSFQAYIDSFNPLQGETELDKLRLDLQELFKGLGTITANHFLSEAGFSVLKPDRILCRILYRLGLIDNTDNNNPNTIRQVIEHGRKFAEATGYPIRYVDMVMVKFGQDDLSFIRGSNLRGICLEKSEPQCNLCQAQKFCTYYKKRYMV